LQGYAAAYALELLALPLGTKDAQRRSHGLQILEGLLTEALPEDPREAKAAAANVRKVTRRRPDDCWVAGRTQHAAFR
jgi:hypothetical protein